jgi:hypothetical protein
LENFLDAKLEAWERRQAFTAYKTAPAASADREAKRQKYLDIAGIHKNWRSDKETSS